MLPYIAIYSNDCDAFIDLAPAVRGYPVYSWNRYIYKGSQRIDSKAHFIYFRRWAVQKGENEIQSSVKQGFVVEKSSPVRLEKV